MTTSRRTEAQDGRLPVLADLSRNLILAEIDEMSRRAQLERAIRDAAKQGIAIDEISEATGLRPDSIHRITAKSHQNDLDFATILGVG